MNVRRFGVGGLLCSIVLSTLGACQTPNPDAPKASLGPSQRTERDKAAAAKTAPEPEVLPRTHFAAGRLHESQNQLNRAIEQYQAAVAIDPGFAEAHNGLGVCMTGLGNFKQAEGHFVKAIELKPDKAYMRNNLAFCYISQRRWADAEAELRNALELKPDFIRARINLGLALAQQSKFDAALEAFRYVLKEEDAQFNMGLMYQSVGRYADADKAFRTAVEKNPQFVAAKERIEKLAPLLQRAQAKAAAKESTPTSQPSQLLAHAPERVIEQPKPKAAPAAPAPVVAQREPERAVQQASPRPKLPPSILPAAHEALAVVGTALQRVVAAGADAGNAARTPVGSPAGPTCIVLSCDVPAALSLPDDLDLPDSFWVGCFDPEEVFDEAEQIAELENGVDAPGQWLPVRVDVPPAQPPRLLANPAAEPVSLGSLQIGAMTLPDDPDVVFPHK